MSRLEDFRANEGVDAKLLANLARQAHGWSFARLALAAGEFPITFEVYAGLSSGYEEPPVVLHNSGGDDERHGR
jgi:hypothetical protein